MAALSGFPRARPRPVATGPAAWHPACYGRPQNKVPSRPGDPPTMRIQHEQVALTTDYEWLRQDDDGSLDRRHHRLRPGRPR
ncbi:hypothetical protein ACPA9J_18760 [Pseudomonas aeruginosa]